MSLDSSSGFDALDARDDIDILDVIDLSEGRGRVRRRPSVCSVLATTRRLHALAPAVLGVMLLSPSAGCRWTGDLFTYCKGDKDCPGRFYCGEHDICLSACAGRECGSGVNDVLCGTCGGETPYCTADGQCVDPCIGYECGERHGKPCGICSGSTPVCNSQDGLCEPSCVPCCSGKVWGPGGGGGTCPPGCSG
ncbi:MAG: hypothetical protein RBU30_14305, partial [Polyangia bacterium]|nr:hypothetical protein [Polyangia bacterium]